MFSDLVNELTIEERLSHAQLMVAVASVDGELVLEELIMIEAIMGKSMLHPEMRVDVRNTLSHPIEMEKSMEMTIQLYKKGSLGQRLALKEKADKLNERRARLAIAMFQNQHGVKIYTF